MMADPRIAQRYQLWIFTYNTGGPILFTAGILHQSLQDAVHLFDPEGQDPALRQMVVIGHSQGGLLAKLTVVESGTRFWEYVSKKSIDELDVRPETRQILRQSFFFTPLPFVSDIIYMGTPQRGSYAAAGGIAYWLADIVTLPASILTTGLEVARAVARDEPGLASTLLKIPSSVRSMDPSRPFTKILSSMPMNPAVEVHSIIALSGKKPLEEDGDGIVAYQSAHIREAVSESSFNQAILFRGIRKPSRRYGASCWTMLVRIDPVKPRSLSSLGHYSPTQTLSCGGRPHDVIGATGSIRPISRNRSKENSFSGETPVGTSLADSLHHSNNALLEPAAGAG